MAQEITPDAIMQLGFGYWSSKTLLSAVELGLFTELAQEPLALEDIRARLNLHPRSVRDFLDALVALVPPEAVGDQAGDRGTAGMVRTEDLSQEDPQGDQGRKDPVKPAGDGGQRGSPR
jgi:hypothetical protein